MSMNIVIATPEALPFAKTGGLADVAGALPKAIAALGHKVSLFMPLYREVLLSGFKPKPTGVTINVPLGKRVLEVEVLKLRHGAVTIYFLKRDEFFDRSYLYGTHEGEYFDNLERFVLFSRGTLEAMGVLKIRPDVLHLNDWQCGLISAYIKSIYKSSFPGTACLFTIHNIAYQGLFNSTFFDLTGLPEEFYGVEGIEFWGKINLLKAGLVSSDIITTVSKGYSKEIQTPEFGYGLEGILAERKSELYGVLNGVDYSVWNPETDEFLAANYSAKSKSMKGKSECKKALIKEYGLKIKQGTPLIGIISRLSDQKGFDILAEAMDSLMAMDVGLVLLGTGEKRYHELFLKMSKKYPDKLGVNIGFDNPLAHRIEAGSDIFLMPSRYEPCGLNQIYSLRYGTIPVVRATGGLDDTIVDFAKGKGNGFKFKEYTSDALLERLRQCLIVYKDKKSWNALRRRAMSEDFSWDSSAKRYVELYKKAINKVSK
jgi:starch synthase